MKINVLHQSDNSFPEVLAQIPDPPKTLYVMGDLTPLLRKPRLAVVGSRKVSPYGRGVTADLARQIASRGVVIVSGLALGVDAIAHRAALEVNSPTIAVLPCGLDKPYPASHRTLARQILEQGGALVSEYPVGTPPMQHHFIARNRLVSGLSDGILITEAARKSGTLHTASFALEQGKTVMAVPGNITSTLSAGTNTLIKTGAAPVAEALDVLAALNLDLDVDEAEIMAANAEEAAILEHLKTGITEASQLQSLSKLEPAAFNQTLTMLEITGKIRPLGAGHWTVLRP